MDKLISAGPSVGALARLDRLEHRFCCAVNRTSRQRAVRIFFKAISRLGDGIFWYALLATLAWTGGETGQVAALQTGLTALLGVGLYKLLKKHLVRERPFITHHDILCTGTPLDRYSFPSGHTLQAVLITTMALAWYPALAPLLLPFTLLVACSRPVLGLHYPSDVACGALIGWGLAQASLWFFPMA